VGTAGEDSAEPGAMIADGSPQAALEERVVEAIEAASTSVALEDALHGLTQSEHTVIVLRHGIGGRQAKKLADVAEELGLSRVRVRQLQHRAEDALRAETPANLALAAGG
jgi:RNA polymerase primary sigma factor